MRRPMRFIGIVTFLAIAATGFGAKAAGGDKASCADCHDELAAKLAATAHGLTQRGAPTCQTCHGEGKGHMENGDKSLINRPAGARGEALCRSCHANISGRILTAEAVHPAASVNCFDCHSIHSGDAAHRLLRGGKPDALCARCHAAQAAEFHRPYGHRLEASGVQCVSCHNPHAGTGKDSLNLDRSGQGPCVNCHAEKRGPFVFAHVGGVTGDCMSCHEAHASNNPRALKRPRIDQLCLECHSPITGGTLGSQPPSTHNLLSARYRNCTVCHVAVHGSNTSARLLK